MRLLFFFSSRRRHTRCSRDWSSDVCSSDLTYTAKGNLVAVVTNGTAVLGLGNIGPLAGKPVMEGKGILFKAFADLDVFDLEVGSENPDDVIRFCQLLEPTVGGINLEDIRSPDCFYIEEQLRATLSIPVFHDDQHGTAIDRKSTRLNSSHGYISYAVFCLKKKTTSEFPQVLK